MQRYFIGISLPDKPNALVTAAQHVVYDPKYLLSPLVPHCTLLYPSLLDMLPSEQFLPQVQRAAAPFLPCRITLSRVCQIRDHAVVIAIFSPLLVELQKTLFALLPPAAAAKHPARRPFLPHVTIAQSSHDHKLPDQVLSGATATIGPSLPINLTISHLSQFIWEHPRQYQAQPM